MSSRCRSRFGLALGIALAGAALALAARAGRSAEQSPATGPAKRVLRVAADPNNLPFSNDRGEGFENKLAELVARELGAELQYSWRAQRRGFFRATLKEGDCDLVMGVPADFEQALTTNPYYRSSYVFVRRRDVAPIVSLDDPALRRVRIGVQLIGDDGANSPPAHALARRGIIGNLTGYTVYGDYRQPNPPARIVDAVARAEIDVAIAWGPLAGYFAARQAVPLEIAPLAPAEEPSLPMAFDIAMGVRRGQTELRDELNQIIARCDGEIQRILDEYGVPRAPVAGVARGSHAEDD